MINKVILFTILSLVMSCQNATEAQTPEAVKKTFQTKYPGENDPDWDKDDHGNYEAHFKMKGVKYRADFSPDGKWIETETSVDKKDLPQAIKDVINKDFKNETITEIEKVEHHSKGTFYDVEFKQKGKNKDVEFRTSGEIIH